MPLTPFQVLMKLLLSACFCLLSYMLPGQTSITKMPLPFGASTVGYKHYVRQDASRTYRQPLDGQLAEGARPISVSLWYPALAGNTGKRLTVLQYMQVLAEEEDWKNLPDDLILNWFYYTNTPANQAHLSEKTLAYLNLPVKPGKYPVIIYAPSYQASSAENFLLCEMLASHGYLVIACPSRGTNTHALEGGTLKDAETQSRDLEFLLAELSAIKEADLDRVGTMGFSFGGLSNILTTMRNSRIKAVVSLDGTVKYNLPAIEKSGYFNLRDFKVPFMHLAQKRIPADILKADGLDTALNDRFTFYDELTNSDAYALQFHQLTHTNFSTMGILFQERDPRQDRPDSMIMFSNSIVAKYVLHFWNAYLKNDQMALKALQQVPAALGWKDEFVTIQRKQATSPTTGYLDFIDNAKKSGYRNLANLYASMRVSDSSFSMNEGQWNQLGLQLVYNSSNSRDGILVFQQATRLYPNSSNLFDSLGEANLFNGDKKAAIIAFKKSLELDQSNENAVNRLRELAAF